MIELSFSFESDSEDEQVFLQVYHSFVGNWKIKEILIAFCFKKNCDIVDYSMRSFIIIIIIFLKWKELGKLL